MEGFSIVSYTSSTAELIAKDLREGFPSGGESPGGRENTVDLESVGSIDEVIIFPVIIFF